MLAVGLNHNPLASSLLSAEMKGKHHHTQPTDVPLKYKIFILENDRHVQEQEGWCESAHSHNSSVLFGMYILNIHAHWFFSSEANSIILFHP